MHGIEYASVMIPECFLLHAELMHFVSSYVRARVEFLLEHTTVPQSEVRLNVDTFRWLERIPPILEEHHDIITRSRREKEDALKVSCTAAIRFI